LAARVFVGTLVHYLVIQKLMHGDAIIPVDEDHLVAGLVSLLVGAGASQYHPGQNEK